MPCLLTLSELENEIMMGLWGGNGGIVSPERCSSDSQRRPAPYVLVCSMQASQALETMTLQGTVKTTSVLP